MRFDELKHDTFYVKKNSSAMMNNLYSSILFLKDRMLKIMVLRKGMSLIFKDLDIDTIKKQWDDDQYTFNKDYEESNESDKKEVVRIIFKGNYEDVSFR